MKKLIVSAALLAASSAALAQQPTILKIAHFWPPTAHAQQKVLEPWCAKLAEQSN